MAGKSRSIVSGLSIIDILGMDMDTFNGLGAGDLRAMVSRLASAGNKRLRRFEEASEMSPAYRHVEKSGGKFSTKGKDLNALRAEFVRAKNFLESETGSLSKWKKVKKDAVKALKKQGVDVEVEDFDKLWRAYEDLKEMDPSVSNRKLKYTILKDIVDMIEDRHITPEEIATELHDKLDLIYEQQEELENGGGVSDFFEI